MSDPDPTSNSTDPDGPTAAPAVRELNDPLECDCPTCTGRRKTGERMHWVIVLQRWLFRAVVVALLALALGQQALPAWAVLIALVVADLWGQIAAVFRTVLLEPRLTRYLQKVFPSRPLYVPWVRQLRDEEQEEDGLIVGAPVRTIRIEAAHPGEEESDERAKDRAQMRAATLSSIVHLQATLFTIACDLKDSDDAPVVHKRVQNLIDEMRVGELEALGYGEIGDPLPEELVRELVASYRRQLQVQEELHFEAYKKFLIGAAEGAEEKEAQGGE